MNIAKHYDEYLKYMDQHARDQFSASPSEKEQDLSFSKNFLKEQSSRLEANELRHLEEELLGAGPLEPLLRDEAITEIMVNSYDQIYFEKNGCIQRHLRKFSCRTSFCNTIERICHESGVELNSTISHCDGAWRGFRLHMVGPSIAGGETKISLRRNSQNNWTLERLVEAGWCSNQEKQILKQFIQKKANVLVIGPTNTGKTTCINACLQLVAENERVIFIEDTDELALPNPVSIKLLTREMAGKQGGSRSYRQDDLLYQCLRMRPDRIVVGEVRGDEAKDYLMTLATGHRGAWCSLHADSPRQALCRLELLIQMAQPQWSSGSIKQLIKMGIDHIVSLENHDGVRRLKGVYAISSLEETGFCLESMTGKID